MSDPYRSAPPEPPRREVTNEKPGLRIPQGATFSLDMTQDDAGYTLATVVRVGRQTKRMGVPRRFATPEELMIAIETWAQDRLARIGLEKVK